MIAHVEKHKLEGRITAFRIDCKPSMGKAGRLVEEQGIAERHRCCNHRLECTTGIGFNGPGAQETMVLSRLVVRRYTTSSQAAQRLGESLEFLKMPKLKVIRDVETRWWSTHACLERLLYLTAVIAMHEESIANYSNTYAARILSDMHSAVIECIALEAELYVNISMVVPNSQALRLGLRNWIEELQAELPAGTPTYKVEARAIVLPCAVSLFDDYNRRWGDRSTILQYRAGPRQQRHGFTRWQLVATALDWRTKTVFYGLDDETACGSSW